MPATPEEREAACALFLEAQGLGYIRSYGDDAYMLWALFDDFGKELIVSDNRSATFFFAAANDIEIRMVN